MCRWRTYGSPPPKFPPNESIVSYMRGAGCVFVRVVIAVLGRNSCVMRLLEKVVDVKDEDPRSALPSAARRWDPCSSAGKATHHHRGQATPPFETAAR
jgi:hypothetical protein